MGNVSLNLARKWRSKQFKEIVGQDLVVRILQNSLFKNTFFPVYLFSGQRGCGKTSTARVFAAAMNCHAIEAFQKDPKNNHIPCLTCESCVAMSHMRHPDFVEIDAASYTGVDNVRNIIDTSSFLPVLSKRKVYLIDEVHMLSKAAFNAFLKILEEPPPFVVFILATTEIQKLPETVKSRCFQLFFNAIDFQVVEQQLEQMCKEENIKYDQDALQLIAQVSEGSLRDAINLLEQARFAHEKVSKKVVCDVLGYVDDQHVYDVFQQVISKKHEALLQTLHDLEKQSVATEYIVKRLQELAYDAVLVKYDVPTKYFASLPDSVVSAIKEIDIGELVSCFNQLSSMDEQLARTSKKQLLFESNLLSMVFQDIQKKKITNIFNDVAVEDRYQQAWDNVLKAMQSVVDPIVYSMLARSEFKQFDAEKKVVHVLTFKKFSMFQDLFIEKKIEYQPLLERFFGLHAVLFISFELVEPKREVKIVKKSAPASPGVKHNPVQNMRSTIDISDEKKWKVTHALLKHFGGTVREIIKDNHESDA